MKIDAEGAEASIWVGMQQTVRRNPEINIVMELKPASCRDADSLLASIADEGFQLRCIDDEGGCTT